MKIALLTTDNREHYRSYSETVPHFGTAPEGLLQGFARVREIEVHVISCTRGKMTSPEKLAPNVWFHSLYVPRIGWTPTVFQGCIRAVRGKLRDIRPDIVHGQGTERDCALNAVFSGFPNVLTVHGNMRLIAEVNKAAPLSYQWQAAQLEKVALSRTGGVVCITDYTQAAVRDRARKTWVVPNAVDASFFEVQSSPGLERIILCVGLVCYRKNQNDFIKALDDLAQKEKFKLVFIGRAAREERYIAEFFDLLAKRSWCEHVGFADRETLKAWFKKASVLALPSREDNCPMVVLEAMAAGVPVLAAHVGGLPELIKDEITGIFCDPLNALSMREGVSRLFNDQNLVRTVTTNARKEADTRFHPLAIAREHIKIYKEVLTNGVAG